MEIRWTLAFVMVLSSACASRALPGDVVAVDTRMEATVDAADDLASPDAASPCPPPIAHTPSPSACGVRCDFCPCGSVPCGPSCCPFVGMWCDVSDSGIPICRALASASTRTANGSACDMAWFEGAWRYVHGVSLPGNFPSPRLDVDSGIAGCGVCDDSFAAPMWCRPDQ